MPTSNTVGNLPGRLIVVRDTYYHDMIQDMDRIPKIKHLMKAGENSPAIVPKHRPYTLAIVRFLYELVGIAIWSHAFIGRSTLIIIELPIEG